LRLVLIGGILALGLGVFWLTGDVKPPALPTSTRVLARLGLDEELTTDPPLEGVRRKVTTTTRLALGDGRQGAWSVQVPDEATAVYFSYAATGLLYGQPADFRIGQVGQEGVGQLFSATLRPRDAGWRDGSVDLLPGTERTLTFTTEVTDGRDASAARLLWGSIGILGLGPAPASAATGKAPNLIVISLDTLGAKYVGFHGARPSPSPYLDELLGRSRTFLNAFAPYPNTLASHASLFTGLYPRRHNLYGGLQAYLEPTTLAMVLADRGYRTAAVTEDAYVSSDFGFDRGFDSYENGSTEIKAEFLGDAKTTFAMASDWLRQRQDEAPYFLFVHTYEVHDPYLARDEHAKRFAEELNPGYEGPYEDAYPGAIKSLGHNSNRFPLAEADIRQMEALYHGEITYLDRLMRSFVAELEDLTDMENTLVVILSDHGDEFGEHGFVGHGESLYDPVLHVLLAFHWPSVLGQGPIEPVVSLVDVMPTVLEMLGADIPADLDGESLTSLLGDRELPSGSRPAFAELRTAWGACIRQGLPRDCRVGMTSVRTPEFKLITSEQPSGHRLYHVATDPDETVDVAQDHPEQLEAMIRLIDAYRQGEPVPSSAGGAGRPEIDDATRERLRALGYDE
jgi:arylsulfatase A-like enzyme